MPLFVHFADFHDLLQQPIRFETVLPWKNSKWSAVCLGVQVSSRAAAAERVPAHRGVV